MSAIDRTKPDSQNPQTDDVRENFGAAADELDGHEQRISSLEQGGGGGGDPKQTIEVGPVDSNEEVTIEHGAIPMDSTIFDVRAKAIVPGPSQSLQLPTYYGEGSSWEVDNLSWFEEGITWTNAGPDGNGYYLGQFSKACLDPVRRGVHFSVNGVEGAICVLGAGPSGVVVTADVPTGEVEWMKALEAGYSSIALLYAYYNNASIYPNMNSYRANIQEGFDVASRNVGSWTAAPSGYAYFYQEGVGWPQCFISKDDGLTWWGWDSAAHDWLPGMDPDNESDQLDHGFRFTNWSGTIKKYDAGGPGWNDMSLAEWTRWVADATVIRFAFYFQTTYSTDGLTFYYVTLQWSEPSYPTVMTCGYAAEGHYGMSMVQVKVKRLSETSMEIVNKSGVDFEDLTLVIYGEAPE